MLSLGRAVAALGVPQPDRARSETPHPEALASLYSIFEAYAPRGSVLFISQAIATADPPTGGIVMPDFVHSSFLNGR